jgi:hypothetical protein
MHMLVGVTLTMQIILSKTFYMHILIKHININAHTSLSNNMKCKYE